MPAFITALKRHYLDCENRRSPSRIERERFLIPQYAKFNRWCMMPAGFLVQFCAGAIYAWSVYNEPVEMYIHGKITNTAASTFYIAIGFLGVASAFYGPFLERHGPRRAAMIGAVFVYAGYLLAAAAVFLKQMWLLLLGFGAIGGLGLGVAYISPVSSMEKWFPDRRGLAAGFGVIGFGSGAIAASPMQLYFIKTVGVPYTFLTIGTIYFVVMMLAAQVLRVPPPDFVVNGLNSEGERVNKDGTVMSTRPSTRRTSICTEYTHVDHTHGLYNHPGASEATVNRPPAAHHKSDHTVNIPHGEKEYRTPRSMLIGTFFDALRSPDYRILYALFFINPLAGLVIVSRLAATVDAVYKKPASFCAVVVSANALLGVISRISMGFFSDKVGRKNCYLFSITAQLFVLVYLYTVLPMNNVWLFIAGILMLSYTYGGTFALIPATLADLFGARNVSACHGVMMSAWSLGAVFSGIVDNLVFSALVPRKYKRSDPRVYQITCMWLFAASIIGFIVTSTFRTRPRDRLYPKLPHQIMWIRVGGRIVRAFSQRGENGYLLEIVAKDKEEREWKQFLIKEDLLDDEQ